MAPLLQESRLTLDYLPYACDFDPQDANRLVVGGGGGANRSGVANRLTAIGISSDYELSVAGEIDLSRDEDSVNTLAVGQKRPVGGGKPASTLVYAGINSSPADVEKGKNEHFRVFSLSSVSPKSSGPEKATEEETETEKERERRRYTAKFAEASRTALFQHHEGDKDAYQRLLRISRTLPDRSTRQQQQQPQLGAVATGFAQQAQIALFEIGTGTSPKAKGVLEISREATDLDVIQTGDDEFQVAYCDEKQIFVVNVSKGGVTGPDLAFTLPEDGTGVIPVMRSIRYLAPGLIMALSNLPRQTGCILSGVRLPVKEGDEGRLAVSATLPRAFSRATCLAVHNLNPPATPGAPIGDTQFVVAVASLQSVSVWTLEHTTHGSIGLLVDLLSLTDLKDVHPLNVTSIALSGFVPAKASVPDSKPSINLASVSMNNTVAVHSIPLKRVADKSVQPRKNGPPRPARYAVAIASHRPGFRRMLLGVAAIVLSLVIVTHIIISSGVVGDPRAHFAAMESQGGVRPKLTETVASTTPEVGTPGELLKQLLPEVPGFRHNDVYVVYEEEDTVSEGRDADAETAAGDDIGEDGDNAEKHGKENVAVPPRIQAQLHDESLHGPAATWKQLSEEQREAWKQKLSEAGYWAESMGESVFNGVLFRELADTAAHYVRDEL